MKKFLNSITTLILAGAALFATASCTETEDNIAKAVLGAESILTFDAASPQAQIVTVYSDAEWHVTAPDWITVDPTTGSGVTDVTVLVSNNTDAQGELAPREDKLIFSGNTKASEYVIVVRQKGDAYRGVTPSSVSQIAALADGTSFVCESATVVAVTAAGCVVTDGTANIYVKALEEGLAVGDVVSIKGYKTTANQMPTVAQVDSFQKASSGEATYPEPINLTEVIASYPATAIEYAKVSGEVASGNIVITIEEQEYVVKLVDPTAEQSLADIEGHIVELTGYTYGSLGAGITGFLAATLKDKGVATIVYFSDDFEWIEPYAAASGAGDSVGTNDAAATSPNVYSSIPQFVEDFNARGYDYYWGTQGSTAWRASNDANPKVLYINKNYLKFGKTSYNAGITLPALSAIPAATDIKIEFDYCFQITGAAVLDGMTLVVESNVGEFEGSSDVISEELATDQPATDSKLYWTHGSVILKGATAETVLKIHPAFPDPYASATTTKCNRWFLDNIKITPADGGGSSSGKVVFREDFEWMEEASVAAGAGDSVANNDPSATAPNIYSTAALEPLQKALAEKGYDFINSGKNGETWVPISEKNDKTVYLQRNYLKFGKTSYNAGIVLPALANIEDTQDVTVEFDWCWQVTGAFNPDIMTLQVEAKNGGTFETSKSNVSDEIESAQITEAEKSKIEWQHAKIVLKGATASTVLTIRPTNSNSKVSNPDRDQNRWYLDNIVIKTL